jgi:hypothetical protein
MSNLFTLHLTAKGGEGDLATLKHDTLKHCHEITSTSPDTKYIDYSVDLADWNPNRQDWVKEPSRWWLEMRRGESELLCIEDGQLKAHAVGVKAPPLHFLDGLRELFPDLELRGYIIDLSNAIGENWRCSPEGTFCVEEVSSCFEGEKVWYWKKDGRLMIDDGKPVAEELLTFAGTQFVMVDGIPTSDATTAAKATCNCSPESDRCG